MIWVREWERIGFNPLYTLCTIAQRPLNNLSHAQPKLGHFRAQGPVPQAKDRSFFANCPKLLSVTIFAAKDRSFKIKDRSPQGTFSLHKGLSQISAFFVRFFSVFARFRSFGFRFFSNHTETFPTCFRTHFHHLFIRANAGFNSQPNIAFWVPFSRLRAPKRPNAPGLHQTLPEPFKWHSKPTYLETSRL